MRTIKALTQIMQYIKSRLSTGSGPLILLQYQGGTCKVSSSFSPFLFHWYLFHLVHGILELLLEVAVQHWELGEELFAAHLVLL